MAQKVKGKIVKKNKSTVWPKIVAFLKTLWSNSDNMNYALGHKWYWAVLVGFVSLIITLIAPVVNSFNVQGSAYVRTSASDSFYYGLYEYYQEADTYPISFADSKLSGTYTIEKYDDYGTEQDSSVKIIKPYYTYVRQGLHVLDIYITDKITDDQTLLAQIIQSNPNYADATTAQRETMTKEMYMRSSSFVFFSTDTIYSRVYAGTNAVASISGNYMHVLEKFNTLNSSYNFKSVLGYDLTSGTNLETHNTILKNYRTYADQIYIDVRNQQGLVTLGLYAGINTGVILLMGFVIWLMCRGKTNPNRSLKIWHGWRISAFQALTPSILALIIGFIMAQFAAMGFVLVYSFRVMFLSMKYLRPAPTTDQRSR